MSPLRQASSLLGACLVLALALAPTARAGEEDRPPPSEAQIAFDEGMALMERGELEEACARLELSVKLEPAMAATYRWAECLERTGKLASAHRRYTGVAKAAISAGMPQRAALAMQRAHALESRLLRVAVAVPDQVAALDGIRVVLDGSVVPPEQWGAVPVDAGSHRITVSADGKQDWVAVVQVEGEGKTTEVPVPVLDDEPRQGAAEPGAGGGGPQRLAGILVASAGVATMGVGAVLAAVADSTYRDSEDYCVDDRCEPEGLDIRATAIGQADIATVLFAVGGGLTVGGVVLWLLAPDGDEPATGGAVRPLDIAVSPTGLWLGGTW